MTLILHSLQVNLDANLGGGTNTVIVDADSLSSMNGRMGSRSHHTYGGRSVEVDSVFLNQLLSAAHSGQRYGQKWSATAKLSSITDYSMQPLKYFPYHIFL